MNGPLVLDTDGSVLPLEGERRVALGARQDELRYGCTKATYDRILGGLASHFAPEPGITFMGSGDYHHLSHALIARHAARGPFQVVVFDNHPDNMLFPFGIHCGSWVWHACRLPFVTRITVLGITSSDVSTAHLFENHLTALWRGKVRYLCLRALPGLVGALGLGRHVVDARALGVTKALEQHVLASGPEPIYLSIDKDALAPHVVRTNWDQGVLEEADLLGAVRLLRPRVFAADVTGEISYHRYAKRWKRLLTAFDGQSDGEPVELRKAQERQREVNAALLDTLA